MNLNKLQLAGRLTRDPELRYTPKGVAVVELGLAINERVKKGDEWVDEPLFVDITVWGSTAENAQKYLTKGRGIYADCRLKLDTWEDKQSGQKRSKLKVVAESIQFLADGKGGGKREEPTRQQRPSNDLPTDTSSDEEDDIPF